MRKRRERTSSNGNTTASARPSANVRNKEIWLASWNTIARPNTMARPLRMAEARPW